VLQSTRPDLYWLPQVTLAGSGHLEIGIALTPGRGGKVGDVTAAAGTLWHELRRLADEGPTPAEIAAAGAARPMKLPASVEGLAPIEGLTTATNLELFGATDEYGGRIAGLPPEGFAARIAQWLRSALLVVPFGTTPELPGMVEDGCPTSDYVPSGEALRPSSFLRRMSRRDGTGSLVLTGDGVAEVRAGGAVHRFPSADLLVLEREKETLLANVAHGCLLSTAPFHVDTAPLAKAARPRRHRTVDD